MVCLVEAKTGNNLCWWFELLPNRSGPSEDSPLLPEGFDDRCWRFLPHCFLLKSVSRFCNWIFTWLLEICTSIKEWNQRGISQITVKFMVGGHSQNRWTIISKFWIRDLALMELLQDGQPAMNATILHWGMNSPPIEISLQKLVYSHDLRWCDSLDVKYFNPTYMILSLHICCMGRAINLQQKCPDPWWFHVPREYPLTALEWCVHITLNEIELSNSVKLSLDCGPVNRQRYSNLQKDQWRKSLLSIGQP